MAEEQQKSPVAWVQGLMQRRGKNPSQTRFNGPEGLEGYRNRDLEDFSPMPPAIAILFTVFIGAMMFVTEVLSSLGIFLFAVLIGFNLMGLVWLEILTMPRFRFGREENVWEWTTWSFLLALSMAAAIVIIATNHLPGQQTNFRMMMEGASYTVNPLLELCLMFLVVSNFVLVHSVWGLTVAPQKFLRSPWTLASVVSLASLGLMIKYPDRPWTNDLLLAIYGSMVIGSAAWIYGRSMKSSIVEKFSFAALPPGLGLMMIHRSTAALDIRDEGTLLTYIILPLALTIAAWWLPHPSSRFRSTKFTDSGSAVLWSNVIILIGTVACIVRLIPESETQIIPLLPLVACYAVFSREHTKKLGGDMLDVSVIHTRDRKRDDKKVNLKFSVLGAEGAGKTCFTTAIWTLLTETSNREIWWSNGLHEKDHKIIEEYSGRKENQTLAEEGGYGSDGYVKMLQERTAGYTCRDLISKRKFPLPTNKPNDPCPFVIRANHPSYRHLQGLKELISPPERGLPIATEFAGKVSMRLNFHAEAKVVSPSLFFKRPLRDLSDSDKEKTNEYDIEVQIKTHDISGESFKAAVEYTRNEMSKPGARRARLVGEEITQEDLSALGIDTESIDEREVGYARDLFLQTRHAFYIVDVGDLINGDKKGVEKFLRMLDDLGKDQDRRLETLQILLNKADLLFDSKAKHSRLQKWHQMNDQKIARQILNDATNHALDDLERSGLKAKVTFTCSFGGLVPDYDDEGNINEDDKGKKVFLPPHPMIPVNVVEPLIDVILSSRLHSEDV